MINNPDRINEYPHKKAKKVQHVLHMENANKLENKSIITDRISIKICQNCNNQALDSDKFCIYCGSHFQH